MADKIEHIGKSLIQHGKLNNRIYLMKLHPDDAAGMPEALIKWALEHSYTKIFAKIPEYLSASFLEASYRVEARIPGFYMGSLEAVFLAFYPDEKRMEIEAKTRNTITDVLRVSLNAAEPYNQEENSALKFKKLTVDNLKALAELYRRVFEVYPFPIFDEDYLQSCMKSHVHYFGCFHYDKLIAASSAEMDQESANAEMTDFATDPQYRGRNTSLSLLHLMEQEIPRLGIKTAYTIARATSYGMNKTFGRMEYAFAGLLVQNTLIGKEIEHMNVWYKKL